MYNTELTAIITIFAALFIGFLFIRLPFVRKTFIPGSMVAGLLLLVLGPQVAGQYMPENQLPANFYDVWALLPGQLINIVFACLFLAHTLIPVKQIWRMAAPQAAFGQMLAWGQYALGGLVAMLVLVPIFKANPLNGALIEISFEGGHGTAAGLLPVFDELNFHEGYELAVGLATVSLACALTSGMILIHWGKRKGYIKKAKHSTVAQLVYHRRIIHELHKNGISLRQHFTLKRMASHLALVGVAVFFGWLIHQVLLQLENMLWGQAGVQIFYYMPIFTLCMFGGMLARALWHKLGFTISRPIVQAINGVSLSVLITTAIATISINYISNNIATFVTLAVVGVVWILVGFVLFAPRMFRRNWFQNGIVNMGQSMGQTATGLLFVKMVDPKDKTNAIESFGYKQLLFEPFVGGGVVTALSLPALALLGLPMFTAIAAAVSLTWLLLGVFYFGKRY